MFLKTLKKADGAIWEIKCAKEEKLKIIGIYIDGGTASDKPSEMDGIVCKEWTWNNVKTFLDTL